jgi:predicted transcriptional regulator
VHLRNLTLRLPPELVQRARILAVQRNTSVNALVKNSLERLVRAEDEYQAAAERIMAAAEKGAYRLRQRKWRRSDLYD